MVNPTTPPKPPSPPSSATKQPGWRHDCRWAYTVRRAKIGNAQRAKRPHDQRPSHLNAENSVGQRGAQGWGAIRACESPPEAATCRSWTPGQWVPGQDSADAGMSSFRA
jgi:hypothetical protein